MRKTALLAVLAVALAAIVQAVPAHAQQTYTAVSAAASPLPSLPGPCGSVSHPCTTLQQAFNVTAAGGVIDVLTPGDYGPLIITHAVSIEGHGWATVTAASGGAIIIGTASTDKINIRGVLLDGLGTGYSGIQCNSCASLNIQDSMIRNFAAFGILFQPIASAQLFVSNTLVSDNSIGIQAINPGAGAVVDGIIDRAEIENNSGGGFSAYGGANFYIRNSAVVDNGGTGVLASASTVRVTRSTIARNATGWGAADSGVVSTFADNNMIDNTVEENGSSNPPPNNPYE